MEKIKTIVDREQLSSNYIGSNQNFGHVLSQVKNLKPPIWKTAWFYGPVGLSVIAIFVSIASISATEDTKMASSPSIIKEKHVTEKNRSRADNIDSPKTSEITLSPSLNTSSTPQSVITSNHPTRSIDDSDKSGNTETMSNDTKVVPKKNMFPNIEGIYTGEISIETLCSGNGIQCNDAIRIISFTIQYSVGLKDVLTEVKGNKIPREICSTIRAQNGSNMIFITNIKGLRDNGDQVYLTSLNYLATK